MPSQDLAVVDSAPVSKQDEPKATAVEESNDGPLSNDKSDENHNQVEEQ